MLSINRVSLETSNDVQAKSNIQQDTLSNWKARLAFDSLMSGQRVASGKRLGPCAIMQSGERHSIHAVVSSKWIPRDRALGLMCSLCCPDLRATKLLVGDAANARRQILNLDADRFDIIS